MGSLFWGSMIRISMYWSLYAGSLFMEIPIWCRLSLRTVTSVGTLVLSLRLFGTVCV